MNWIFARLALRGSRSKYRKILSTEEAVFPAMEDLVESSAAYAPGTLLDDGEWFVVPHASKEPFALDIFDPNYETPDWDVLDKSEFSKIDFLFVKSGGVLFFQNISKAKLASRKRVWEMGEEYRFQSEAKEIVIQDCPDAIYSQKDDALYFRRLESVTGIFKDIGQLYKEATIGETQQFLQSDFIQLKNDYSAVSVKTANRKRIALAAKTLSALKEEERSNIYAYIVDYCPGLKTQEGAFSIGSEEELKLLLFGIEQRFYTTPVGGEKRIANSVIVLR